MASINSCTFSGRAGRDPEVRYFEGGTMVAEFSIAIDGFKRDQQPIWLPVKIWGKQAQVAADFVRKGSKIGISGKLEQETWTDRNTGDERSKLLLNCQQLTLLDSRRNDAPDAPADEGDGIPF